MNKSFRLMFVALLSICCCAFVAQAENAMTVYDDTQVSPYVPLPTANYNEAGTRGQVIYPAEELTAMVGQTINGITLYINNEGCKMNGGQLRVSMGEVDVTTFSSTTFFTGLTQVAMTQMHAGATVVDIIFDEPYIYNGGNLLIEFYVKVGGESQAYNFTYFYGHFQQGHSSLTTGDEGNEYREFIPKTTFYYGDKEAVSAIVNPRALTFNTVRAGERDEQTVYLINSGLNAFTPVLTANAPFSVTALQAPVQPGETVGITIAFEPASAGLYEGSLMVDCGEGVVLEVPMNGTALENGLEFLACPGDVINQYVPFNGIYADDVNTMGQMIYPADKLATIKDGKIIAMSFFTESAINLKNVVLQLSLMNTEQVAFDQATPMTGLTAVATADVIKGESQITFELDEPFKYTGENLAVEVKVVGAGWTATTRFRGQETLDYSSLSCYKSWSGDKKERYKFLPMVNFTYQVGADVLRGDVNDDTFVNITDAIKLISAISTGDYSGINMDNADVDGSETVNITDVISLINFILSGNWPD